MSHHVLAKLVGYHAGVIAGVGILHANDLERPVRKLSDPLVLRDRTAVSLPVQLRSRVPDCGDKM